MSKKHSRLGGASSAARRHSEIAPKLAQARATELDRPADFAFGNSIAVADIHKALIPEGTVVTRLRIRTLLICDDALKSAAAQDLRSEGLTQLKALGAPLP
jgi:hypothetical protein